MKNILTGFKQTALVSALLVANGAQAATINVDGVNCTLNDAVFAANTDAVAGGCTAGSAADVLELPNEGNISLAGSATVSSEVTINGNNSTITGDILLVTNGNLTINDVTVSGVNSDYAPLNASDSVMNINRSIISGNTGGGVMFRPDSSGAIVDTVIENNTGSGSDYYGAGLSVASSSVIVTNSTISNNTNNSNTAGGGGIWVNNYFSAVDLSISNTTVSGNTSQNRGGGISHSDYGNGAEIMIVNLTLVANMSASDGGGLANDGANISIAQSLISGNTGTGGTEIESTAGTIIVDDYNLFGLNSTSGVVGVTVGSSDLVPSEATLAEIIDVNLVDNGGPTPTHALAVGSPAIDAVFAVPAASCSTLIDQTGKARPIDGDADGMAVCDIGAFENPNPDIIFENNFD